MPSDTTVIVTTSPIPSHPETTILEETIASVRHHLPGAEIILTFDGIRPEHAGFRDEYIEYTRRALWRADHQWGNVMPIVHNTHRHQVGITRAALDQVRTPLLLFVEHDTPLVTDEEIDWHTTRHLVMEGIYDLVRFHHEAAIPEPHMHMMLPPMFGGFTRTCQWSQRPHLASTAFYHRILSSHFSPTAKSFIEDMMHGVCHDAYERFGLLGWDQYRLAIYHPEGGNIKRSYHTDGRAGGPKFDDTQEF